MSNPGWNELVELFAANGDLAQSCVDDGSGRTRAEAARLAFQTLLHAYPIVLHGDPAHPDWMPQLNNLYALAAANPDTTYNFATIDGAGVYRLSGTRGSVRRVDIQSGVDMAGIHEQPGPTLETFSLDDFTIDADGRFSFLWSAQRPAGHAGDWVRLDPRANYVMVRQIACDWEREVDARIAIERLDAPPVRPRMGAEAIHAGLAHALQAARRTARMFPAMLADKRARGIVNRLELNRYSTMGGIPGQSYYEGLYELGADEALIVQARVPHPDGYWSVQLFDELFVSLDWMHRLSCLNGHTAHAAADGTVQAVVCARDPGVRNWLDVSDYPSGGVMWRWLGYPDAPAPACTRVRFDAIDAHLLPGTPRVDSDERAGQYRARRVGAQMRRRW